MEDNKKGNGLKWVIFADVLGAIVIGLLVWASLIEDKLEAEASRTKTAVTEVPNYDKDLTLSAQNCEGVEGEVDVVLITDANYMEFTRVAINSAKKTKCPASKYNFHVMTLDVSASDEAALKAMAEDNVTVSVLPQKEVDLFYIRDTHVSKTSLLKYYIARELPELNKALYIDSDVLVLHDLNTIYNTNIDGKYLAVVKDPSWFFENMHVVELPLQERGFYFNSGVMLMNLQKFRADGLEKKLEDYTNNNFRTYMDQDALNVIVGNDVVLLPFEANAMNFFFEHNDLGVMGEFYGRSWANFEEVFAPVTVLHFASSKKPLGAVAPNTEFFRMLQRLWYKYYEGLPALD